MMDGFAETRFMSGVLFAEDFDDEPLASMAVAGSAPAAEVETTPIAWEERPRYSETELRDATAIARDDGFRMGTHAALEGVEAKRLAAIEHAVASLKNAGTAARAVMEDECGRIAASALTLLLGFLPCIAEHLALEQVRSTALSLVRTLVDVGSVTIAVHPDLLENLEPALSSPDAQGIAITLLPDPAMARCDFAARWHDGHGRRDTASLRLTMRDALAEAGLLEWSIVEQKEDLRHGH